MLDHVCHSNVTQDRVPRAHIIPFISPMPCKSSLTFHIGDFNALQVLSLFSSYITLGFQLFYTSSLLSQFISHRLLQLASSLIKNSTNCVISLCYFYYIFSSITVYHLQHDLTKLQSIEQQIQLFLLQMGSQDLLLRRDQETV